MVQYCIQMSPQFVVVAENLHTRGTFVNTLTHFLCRFTSLVCKMFFLQKFTIEKLQAP